MRYEPSCAVMLPRVVPATWTRVSDNGCPPTLVTRPEIVPVCCACAAKGINPRTTRDERNPRTRGIILPPERYCIVVRSVKAVRATRYGGSATSGNMHERQLKLG